MLGNYLWDLGQLCPSICKPYLRIYNVEIISEAWGHLLHLGTKKIFVYNNIPAIHYTLLDNK